MSLQSTTGSVHKQRRTRTAGTVNIRYMAVTAMLSAVAFVLMYLEFSIPVMPAFIKLDLSDLPELIGSFAMGPGWGVLVCLIKNLLHAPFTSTGCVGELSNFILGACFVLPAGLVYGHKKSKNAALAGAVLGAALMAVVSVFSNYFIVYPVYTAIMPMETIIGMYQVIYSGADTLLKCLIIFNLPFTFAKGLVSVAITFAVYKHISPLIKGAGC